MSNYPAGVTAADFESDEGELEPSDLQIEQAVEDVLDPKMYDRFFRDLGDLLRDYVNTGSYTYTVDEEIRLKLMYGRLHALAEERVKEIVQEDLG